MYVLRTNNAGPTQGVLCTEVSLYNVYTCTTIGVVVTNEYH